MDGDPTLAFADPEYLRVVLTNLLENAIEYSGTGTSVSVSTRAEGDGAVIVVRDTGPGIPAEALPHIFERFYRVDTARARESGGSGLGLSIASEIVEAHGGRLSVESGIGVGSAFEVRLPKAGAELDA
jgi:signal transduction histidine kinase